MGVGVGLLIINKYYDLSQQAAQAICAHVMHMSH